MNFHVKLMDGLEKLYASASKAAFNSACLDIAEHCFESAVAAFHEVGFGSQTYHTHECRDPRANKDVRRAWDIFATESPVVKYYRAGGCNPVIRTNDLISEVNLRNSGFYQECWKPFGTTQQVGVRFWTQTTVCGLSIKRDSKFSDAEMSLLSALHPHFLRCSRLLAEARFAGHGGTLTTREAEVLGWIRAGKRDGEIAVILGIAPKTLSKHVEHILRKLKVETRTAAVAESLRERS